MQKLSVDSPEGGSPPSHAGEEVLQRGFWHVLLLLLLSTSIIAIITVTITTVDAMAERLLISNLIENKGCNVQTRTGDMTDTFITSKLKMQCLECFQIVTAVLQSAVTKRRHCYQTLVSVINCGHCPLFITHTGDKPGAAGADAVRHIV